MAEVFNELQSNLGQSVLAIGALGTAAYGLVDVTKALWGGVSNAGFNHVEKGLAPYGAGLQATSGPDWKELLRSHWVNGRSKADQKAIARAFVRLGLTEATAESMARPALVDPAALKAVAAKLAGGQGLSEADRDLLGRFDVALEAQLDAAFERAEQAYRSAARGWAAVTAIVLAQLALLVQNDWRLDPGQFWLGLFVGVLAVPLAPVAKDLASAINAAMNAVRGRAAG